jgi:hypothetical protein
MSVDRAGLCEECGSPLADDQRYCLGCGARVGARNPQLVDALRRMGEPAPVGGGTAPATITAPARIPAPAQTPSGGASRTLRFQPPPLPPPKVWALLTLVFLGFGVILGGAAGSRVDDTLAASARPHLELVLPAARSSASTPSTSAASPPSSLSALPQESEPEPTRPPSAASEATTKPAAKVPSSSKASEGEERSSESSSQSSSRAPAAKLPAIKHVFVIMLSDEPYAAVFGPASSAHYLSQTLERRGELLVRYYAVAHEQLANGIALLSGQGPTAETAANCPTYADVAPARSGAGEQLLGNGCVYPASTKTLAGQLSARHLTWRAYVEGMDEAGSQAGACGHPALGQADPTAAQGSSGGPYATFSNPFVYFHSVIDSPSCAANDVGLDRLKGDLASAKRTPSLSYIVPDRCHDGNPTPCAAGAPAGLVPADGFLKRVVPEITGSKAYRESGLLAITVDEAPSSGEFADSSSCCGQPRFPNMPALAGGLSPRGGGTVGALLLSPFLLKSGSTGQEPYDHFSLLRTIEDLFSLKHLGYAGLSGVRPFEAAMFSATAKG